LHVKARQADHLAQLQHGSGDATNEHAISRIAALSADLYLDMNGAGGVVSKALWSFLLCFFEVAFFWQRVRLHYMQLFEVLSDGMLIC
jgi:hypothetical protein